MGCGHSTTISSLQSIQEGTEPQLVIIGGETSSGPPHSQMWQTGVIQIVSLRCKHRRNMKLPTVTSAEGTNKVLTHGYSAVSHPDKPILFLTGGCYGYNDTDSSCRFWMVDLRNEDDIHSSAVNIYGDNYPDSAVKTSRQLPDMPKCLSNHQSCFAHVGNDTCLFLAGRGDTVLQFNFTTHRWRHLPRLMPLIGDPDGIFFINGALYVAASSRLYKMEFRYHQLSRNLWNVVRDGDFPRGKAVTINDCIYVHKFHPKTNAIYKYDCLKDTLTKHMVIDECDAMEFGGMVAYGENIYFAGGVDSVIQRISGTIVQCDISRKSVAIAGFLNSPLQGHKLLASDIDCSQCKSKNISEYLYDG